MMMPVPMRIVRVWLARKAKLMLGSSMGYVGGSGEGGACGSGSTTCSPAHTDSKPAASAACATRTDASGVLHGPMLIPKSASFMRILLPFFLFPNTEKG